MFWISKETGLGGRTDNLSKSTTKRFFFYFQPHIVGKNKILLIWSNQSQPPSNPRQHWHCLLPLIPLLPTRWNGADDDILDLALCEVFFTLNRKKWKFFKKHFPVFLSVSQLKQIAFCGKCITLPNTRMFYLSMWILFRFVPFTGVTGSSVLFSLSTDQTW